MAATTNLVLDVLKDTYVRTDLDDRRNDNYGLQDFIEVGTGRGGDDQSYGAADAMRSLLQFDLSSITQPRVKEAILELTITGYDDETGNGTLVPNNSYVVDVHKLLGPWQEGNGYEGPNSTPPPIGNPLGAVWVDEAYGVAWAGVGDNSDPDAENNQTQPPFAPSRVARAIIQEAGAGPGTKVRLDITSLVNEWLSNPSMNYGMVLRDATTSGVFQGVRFASQDGSGAEAKLLITLPTAGFNQGGSNGKDRLVGNAGDDTLTGYNGQDVLLGNGGNDILDGGNGPDTLRGGIGADTLMGGNGPDQFILAAGEGTDVITDFQRPDVIALAGGMRLADLSFSGDEILLTSTNEVLAILTGVDTTLLTARDFVIV